MRFVVPAAILAAFFVSPASAEPISAILVASIGLTGSTAAIASSILTLGLAIGASFIPSPEKDR